MSTSKPTLVFPGMPKAALVATLENLVHPHPLADAKNIEVHRQSDGTLVLALDEGQRGFTFCRPPLGTSNDLETLTAFFKSTVAPFYMPMTYEVDVVSSTNYTAIIEDILENYRQKYDAKHVAKIDTYMFVHGNKHLLLVLLPRELVEAMAKGYGGKLVTRFRGRVGDLRAIKTLAPVLPEDADEDGEVVVDRAFATQYGEGGYWAAFAIHQSVVREIVTKPNRGISVGPIGVWQP